MPKKIQQKLSSVTKNAAEKAVVGTIRQKRCWALAVAEIQKYAHMDINWNSLKDIVEKVPLNSNGEYVIEINPEYIISKGKPMSSVLETLKKMTETWVFTDESALNCIDCSLFVLFSNYAFDGKKYYACLPIRSLKWLINLQKGKYMTFHVESFIKLTSLYSMDLYLYISSNYGRENKTWSESLNVLKERLGCPSNYTYDEFKRRVLEPAIEEFKNKHSMLTFTYTGYPSLDSLSCHGRGRKNIDTIEFTIVENYKVKDELNQVRSLRK